MYNFHNKLAQLVEVNDGRTANSLLMQELGVCLVKSRKDFVDLLTESGIGADENMTDTQLVKLFMDNISKNRKLVLGSALLVNMHNKLENFDGDNELCDTAVKQSFNVMQEYFNDGQYDDFNNEEFANAGGVIDSIATAVGAGANLGSKIAENKGKKKYGVQDILAKKQDAKAQLTQSIIDQRKAQLDAETKKKADKAKITKILIIGGVSVAVLSVLGYVIWRVKYKK